MKCISFALYGYADKYKVGALKNFEQISKMLPDWSMNLYYHEQLTDMNIIEQLKNNGANTINMTEYKIGDINSIEFPMFWRFTSFFSDTPSLSRDLDSRLSLREVEYIKRWEERSERIFIIRDHPWHSVAPGGLTGVKNIGKIFESHFYNFIKQKNLGYGADQTMLQTLIENVKDVYCCSFENNFYIPRDDKKFFIGMQIDENEAPICKFANNHLLSMGL